LTRGEIAKRTGCNIETVRYYEKVGILPEPPRTSGGHRVYGEEHLKRLVFVRRSRELGFSIEEITGLLSLVDGGDYSCSEVHALTVKHIESIQSKIADLTRLETNLTEMAAHCSKGDIPECHVVDTLFQTEN
jgi:MerR family transcriptional regulator, mercuric resistance operon regulatory protein